MRRAATTIGLVLVTLAFVACEGGLTPEQVATKQALIDAHVARAAVTHLVSRYGEVLEAPLPADAPPRSWEDVAAWRASAEGLAAGTYIAALVTPAPVDPTFQRAKDIAAVTGGTAELVRLALEPQGDWEAFRQAIETSKLRLLRAVEALEKGTKSYVLIETRQETNMRTAGYTEMLAKARSSEPTAPGGPTPTP